MLAPLVPNGVFVLNCIWPVNEIETHLPAAMKRELAQKNAQVFVINAHRISSEAGLGGHINLVRICNHTLNKLKVMQVAFFAISKVIDINRAIELLKESVETAFKKKGSEVIEKNKTAISRSLEGLQEVKYDKTTWMNATDLPTSQTSPSDSWLSTVKLVIDEMRGDSLPVSAFNPRGISPTGTTRFEKRGIAVKVPNWDQDKCVQCTLCSMLCPHAAIRPFLLTPQEASVAPINLVCKPTKGLESKELLFRIQVIKITKLYF